MSRSPLLAVAAIALLGPFAAHAEQVSRTLDGKRLLVDVTCVAQVDIRPQAGLAGKVMVEANSNVEGELKDFAFAGGDTASVARARRDCTGTGNDRPKITVAIQVPAGIPIDIRNAGSTDFVIGPVGGTLAARLAGSGKVKAESVTDLDLSIAGSSDTQFAEVTGAGDIHIAGSGSMKIANAAMASLKIDIRGSGSVGIDQGKVGKLSAAIAGSGNLHVKADVQDADLSTFGSGSIDVAKVSGVLSSSRTGSGSIRIGHAGPG
jgi:hypothetical protein